MLEPFGEVGGDVPEYFSSRTHFAKIEDKKVIAKKLSLKTLQLEFSPHKDFELAILQDKRHYISK